MAGSASRMVQHVTAGNVAGIPFSMFSVDGQVVIHVEFSPCRWVLAVLVLLGCVYSGGDMRRG